MKLTSITIKNFRSIIEISNLPIDEKLTTLVGANEHGKSNILYALKFLDTTIGFDLVNDRRLDVLSEPHYPEIEYTISLTDEEKASVDVKIFAIYDALTPELKETSVQPNATNKIVMVRNCDPDKIPVDILGYNDPYKAPFTAEIDYAYRGKVIYFDDFNERLLSVLPEAEILNTNNQIVNGLLKLAGLLHVRTKIFDDTAPIRRLLNDASRKLTDAVKKNWFQGNNDDLSLHIDINHHTKTLKIDLGDKNSYLSFEARSRGFKWFLSFFLKYRAYSDGELKDCIFLLDEPGLFLHPKGQKDLLNYFEEFGKYNQIIYTTHSPFMINRLNQKRVRVVEKFDKKGTLVNSKGHIKNWKPLRSSLGLALSDSFYFADNTLLVEGPEDRIYILSLLKLYAEKELKNIDLNILSIMDAGGSGELPAMARILNDEERPLLVLIDSDSTKSYNKLTKFIAKKNLKEIKQFNKTATTIQDLLPQAIFEKAVNNFIDKLVSDGDIERKDGKKDKFVVKSPTKIDKDVDEYTLGAYNDEISKVGIANEFEKIILDENFTYQKQDFTDSNALIDLIIKELNLEIQL